MIEALDFSIKTYVLFTILFLLFIFIPQAHREDNSFFFAIFKFYFVIIPVMIACAGVFGFFAGPIFAFAGIFLAEALWVTCLYLYCFCLYLFLRICELRNWNYKQW